MPGQAAPKSKTGLFVGLGIGALVLFGACGAAVYAYNDNDKAERREVLARICRESGDMLRDGASGDNFQQVLSNALQSCSGACDFEDAASCRALDDHLTKICGVSATICGSLCKEASSPSLREGACKHK